MWIYDKNPAKQFQGESRLELQDFYEDYKLKKYCFILTSNSYATNK